jgi:hypothetical protein
VLVIIKHIQKEKYYMPSLGLEVLPTRVNALGYLRLRQTTALSQHPSVEAELASHTPRKINDL